MIEAGENIKKVCGNILPFCVVIVLEMLMGLPLGIPHFATVTPALPLIAVFYFAVYGTRCFGVFTAFLCGLCADVMFMMPMGSNALVYALMCYGAQSLRRFIAGKSFAVTWVEFALFATLAMVLQWLILSIIYKQVLTFSLVLMSNVFLISCYPLVAALCFLVLKINAEDKI